VPVPPISTALRCWAMKPPPARSLTSVWLIGVPSNWKSLRSLASGSFGDEKAGGRALRVVRRGNRVWNVAFQRPAAGHRRKHHPVIQVEIAQLVGREQFLRPRGGAARGVVRSHCGGFVDGHFLPLR
jgi:hypothetical protein